MSRIIQLVKSIQLVRHVFTRLRRLNRTPPQLAPAPVLIGPPIPASIADPMVRRVFTRLRWFNRTPPQVAPAPVFIGPPVPASITDPKDWSDLQAWARRQPHLPRYFGLPGLNSKSAAMLNQGVLTAQYKRFRAVFELIDVWPMMLPGLMLVLGIGAGLILSAVGYSTQPSGLWTVGHTLVITVVATVFVAPAGLPVALRMRYVRAYCQVFILEFNDPIEHWRITAVGRTWMPRLGFADSRGYFVGGTTTSGIRNGSVLLAVDSGDKPLSETRMNELWRLQPVERQMLTGDDEPFHGASARAAKATELRAEEGGRIKLRMKKSFFGDLTETGLIVLCVALAILTFLQVQTGYEVTLTNLDPAAVFGGAP